MFFLPTSSAKACHLHVLLALSSRSSQVSCCWPSPALSFFVSLPVGPHGHSLVTISIPLGVRKLDLLDDRRGLSTTSHSLPLESEYSGSLDHSHVLITHLLWILNLMQHKMLVRTSQEILCIRYRAQVNAVW
jgi:hypothetical protein